MLHENGSDGPDTTLNAQWAANNIRALYLLLALAALPLVQTIASVRSRSKLTHCTRILAERLSPLSLMTDMLSYLVVVVWFMWTKRWSFIDALDTMACSKAVYKPLYLWRRPSAEPTPVPLFVRAVRAVRLLLMASLVISIWALSPNWYLRGSALLYLASNVISDTLASRLLDRPEHERLGPRAIETAEHKARQTRADPAAAPEHEREMERRMHDVEYDLKDAEGWKELVTLAAGVVLAVPLLLSTGKFTRRFEVLHPTDDIERAQYGFMGAFQFFAVGARVRGSRGRQGWLALFCAGVSLASFCASLLRPWYIVAYQGAPRWVVVLWNVNVDGIAKWSRRPLTLLDILRLGGF